jgi:adhesin/invasin
MTRRLLVFVALTVVAIATANAAISGASFTAQSATTLSASTSPVSSDAMRANAGDGQSATVNTAVAVSPSVLVTDTGGNPVSGILVAFSVTSGGGWVTGSLVVTDSYGVAAVGDWILGPVAGPNGLRASAAGLGPGTVDFTAMGTAPLPTRCVVTSDSYSPTAGSEVTIEARLMDGAGNSAAYSGIPVTFTSTGGAVTGANPDATDAAGIATTTVRVPTTAGATFTVTATAAGMSPVVAGTSPAIRVTASSPDHMSLNAGDGQSATAGTAVATNPSVRVADVYNNPCSSVPVTFAVASGGGSVTGGSATTNASGIAAVSRWTLGTTVGSNTLTASASGLGGSPVTFTATATVGPASKYVVTASTYLPTVGTSLTVNAQLADQYGNAVGTSGVLVTWSRTGAGGSFGSPTSVTGAGGLATVQFTTGTVAGVVYALTATDASSRTGTSAPVEAVQRAPATVAIFAGNGQSAAVGTAVAVAPSVRVTDVYNNPCGGIPVTFAVAGGAGSVTGATATTDASGVATVGSWTLGPATGANTLTATVSGVSPATFTATGLVGSPAKYVVTASTYAPVVGTAVTVSAQLADQFGNPVKTSGITVNWTKSGTGGSLPASSVTNTSGIATATFTTGTVAGTDYRITATDSSSRTGTSGTITPVSGTPVTWTRYDGNNQTAPAGTAVPIAPSVLITDTYGNPCAGVTVTFSVTSGGGSITSGTAVTSASGIARVGSWTLGTTPGSNRLRATWNSKTLTFSATGVVGPAAKYLVTSSSYAPAAGAYVTISAQLADQFGNAVATSGVTVTWSKTGTGGSFATATSITNASGVATVRFTTGTPAPVVYVVTGTDGSGRTGSSPNITTH